MNGHKARRKNLFLASMSAIAVGLGATAIAVCAPSSAWADAGPHLISAHKSALCDQILKAAKAAYASKATSLEDAYESVKAARVGLVVSPSAQSSDPPTMWCDPNFVDSKVPTAKDGGAGDEASKGDTDQLHGLYWQKKICKGGRFVVAQRPMNWKGDWYGLYLLDGKIADDEVASFVVKNTGNGQVEMKSIPSATIVYDDLWHAPWLFHNDKTGEFAGVDVKAEWLSGKGHCMPDWAIYTCEGGKKAVRIGTIQFTTADSSLQLLPKGPLRDLSKLLDEMVGHPAPGSEGTMNQTASLRERAEQAWTALAARPWAMPEPPLSKAETDKRLLEWSQESKANKTKYARLQALYPQALTQLKSHYRTTLHKSDKEAAQLSEKAIASAYCSNFSF